MALPARLVRIRPDLSHHSDGKDYDAVAASYTKVLDVYGLMGIMRIPQDAESEDVRFLGVIVDCKSVGRLDMAEIYSISVAGFPIAHAVLL